MELRCLKYKNLVPHFSIHFKSAIICSILSSMANYLNLELIIKALRIYITKTELKERLFMRELKKIKNKKNQNRIMLQNKIETQMSKTLAMVMEVIRKGIQM